MKLNFKVIIIALIAGAIALVPDISYARDPGGIDVVLVMDSSGSMKKTDPQSLRIPAAKLFISLLDKNDRAGVISFSSDSDLLIGLTSVTGEDSKNMLLKSTERISSDGLYTNLHDALRKGLEVLSRDEQAENARIIVLMSDGMMDVGDPDRDRKLIDNVKSGLVELLTARGIKVYSIAFTEQSDKQLLQMISKQTGGFYNLALQDNDFHLIFTSIFESLKTPEMLPMSKNGFLIDSSVQEVTVVATKDSPDTRIQIDSPDGQSFTNKNHTSNIKWFESDKFDMITVKNPPEGRWEILFSAGENNKAYIITNLTLNTNFDQLYTIYGKPLDIDVWLDKDGTSLKEPDVLDKIDIIVEMISPDGKSMVMKPFNKGDGVFQRRIVPFTAGNYRLRIIAKGMTFEREKTYVFNVAGIEESKEVLKAERSRGKIRPETETEKVEYETATISWISLIAKFLSINFVLGIIMFIYMKRNNFKKIALLMKRKKAEEPGPEIPAAVEDQQDQNIKEKPTDVNVQAGQQEQAEQKEPEEQKQEIASGELDEEEAPEEQAVQKETEEQQEIASGELDEEETPEEQVEQKESEEQQEIALEEVDEERAPEEQAVQKETEEQQEIALEEVDEEETPEKQTGQKEADNNESILKQDDLDQLLATDKKESAVVAEVERATDTKQEAEDTGSGTLTGDQGNSEGKEDGTNDEDIGDIDQLWQEALVTQKEAEEGAEGIEEKDVKKSETAPETEGLANPDD